MSSLASRFQELEREEVRSLQRRLLYDMRMVLAQKVAEQGFSPIMFFMNFDSIMEMLRENRKVLA
jgi:hypothetical protein